MKNDRIRFEFCDDSNVSARSTLIAALIAVVEPDPEYWPYFISDEATIWDVSAETQEVIESRLRAEFGSIVFDLGLPLWRLADSIKAQVPRWMEE